MSFPTTHLVSFPATHLITQLSFTVHMIQPMLPPLVGRLHPACSEEQLGSSHHQRSAHNSKVHRKKQISPQFLRWRCKLFCSLPQGSTGRLENLSFLGRRWGRRWGSQQSVGFAGCHYAVLHSHSDAASQHLNVEMPARGIQKRQKPCSDCQQLRKTDCNEINSTDD